MIPLIRVSNRKPTDLTHQLLSKRRLTAQMNDPLNIDSRQDLPQEWLFLLREYPRDAWLGHGNLGPLTNFWLNRHDGFRNFGNTLISMLRQFREGQIPPERFGGMFAPQLQHFLTELHNHHMIEDHHYFPVFMEAEKRLLPGFELLENDHEVIHHRIETVIGSANELIGQLQEGDRDAIRRASDNYAATSDMLLMGLKRHLADEEDLIVPIILSRGESELGLS